jgi:hypothetical protein
MKDDLKKNGRKLKKNGRQTQFFFEDLKKIKKWKTTTSTILKKACLYLEIVLSPHNILFGDSTISA